MKLILLKFASEKNIYRNSIILSMALHSFLFISILSASISNREYISSSDIKISDVDVDISEIPPEFIGGDKDPKKVEKEEWIEGTGKNTRDTPAEKEDIDALSGKSMDGDGYLFSIHGDSPPIPIIHFNVNDFFPREAKTAGIREKVVQVTVQVDDDGTLKKASVTSRKAGYGFDEAALKIVRLARFRPGYVNGKPVKMNHTLEFQFELE